MVVLIKRYEWEDGRREEEEEGLRRLNRRSGL